VARRNGGSERKWEGRGKGMERKAMQIETFKRLSIDYRIVHFKDKITVYSALHILLEDNDRPGLSTGTGGTVWVPWLKIDPLRLLVGCLKRRLN